MVERRSYRVGETIRLDTRVTDPVTRAPTDATSVVLDRLVRGNVTVPAPATAFTRVAAGDYMLLLPTTDLDPGAYDYTVRVTSPAGIVLTRDQFVLEGVASSFEIDVQGEFASLTVTAGVALSGHRVVSPRGDGKVEYADATFITHLNRSMWLTLGAVAANAPATVLIHGWITEPSWAWTPGLAIFLGAAGLLTQALPVAPGSAFLLRLGVAISATAILFDPQQPIALA